MADNVMKRLNAMRRALLDATYETTMASTELDDLQYATNAFATDTEAFDMLKEAQAHIDEATKLCEAAKNCVRSTNEPAVAANTESGLDASLAAYRRQAKRFVRSWG